MRNAKSWSLGVLAGAALIVASSTTPLHAGITYLTQERSVSALLSLSVGSIISGAATGKLTVGAWKP